MKTIKSLSFIALLIVTTLSASAQISNDFRLPDTWTKDFTITLSYHSSMSGGSTDIKFTYDSCIYKSTSNRTKPTSRIYILKESDRVAILQRLHELKAGEIRSESAMHVVHDGWSQSICFNVHCIEGGTSAEMSDNDKDQFLNAYRYLEEFAMKKRR